MKRIILLLLAAILILAGCERLDPPPEIPEVEEPYEVHPGVSWEPTTAARTLKIGEEVISEAEFDYYLNRFHSIYFGTLTAHEALEEMAAEEIRDIVIMLAYAEEHGIELEEGEVDELIELWSAEYEESDGFAKFLVEQYGDKVTIDEFRKIAQRGILGNRAMREMDKIYSWTDEEVRAHFEENRDTYYDTSDPENDYEDLISVRHLLVMVYNEERAAMEGKDVRTAAEARARAEELLKTWKDGAADEDYFVELVEEHTDDGKGRGGLYADLTPESEYMEEFRDWAVSEDRKRGDTAIIEVEGWYHGFHIMYYVGHTWIEQTKERLSMAERDRYVDALLDDFPIILE